MEPTDPSFADEFNVPQEDAVIVFDARGAVVSLPFQVHRLKVLVEAGLIAFSIACFEFADAVPPKSSAQQPCAPFEVFCQPFSRPFEGCCCGVLRAGAFSPPLSAVDKKCLCSQNTQIPSIKITAKTLIKIYQGH